MSILPRVKFNSTFKSLYNYCWKKVLKNPIHLISMQELQQYKGRTQYYKNKSLKARIRANNFGTELRRVKPLLSEQMQETKQLNIALAKANEIIHVLSIGLSLSLFLLGTLLKFIADKL